VMTAEIDPRYADAAQAVFDAAGRAATIELVRGSSEAILAARRDALSGKRVLFYLDAHWHDYWPLRDELRAIAGIDGPRPVVVIHDVQVPGRPHLGFDAYHGTPLDLEYVRDGLDAIYHGTCVFHYNDVAAGARRGVLFVQPRS
jgi:hypothetical protein